MRTVHLILHTTDPDYNTQTKIIDDLINKGFITQYDVINVTEESIQLELESTSKVQAVKSRVSSKYRSLVDMSQSAFAEGMASAGVSSNVTSGKGNISTFDQNGEGAGSGIVVGVGEGMGNANLKGTTFINGQSRSKINVDDIIYDRSQYSDSECPVITYYAGCESMIYLPVSQEEYSVGVMTQASVNYLNSKFEEQLALFASDEPGNSGTITTPVTTPDDIIVSHRTNPTSIDSEMNNYISIENERRSADARDKFNSPAYVMTKGELAAVISRARRDDCGNLPRLNSPRNELIQRLLAFNSAFDLDQAVYSISGQVTGYATRKAVSKLANNAINNVTESTLGPNTGKYAVKAARPLTGIASRSAGNFAKSLI